MDFLNRSFAQLKDLFLSMTPGARITAGLLLAVVVVSLGYLFTHEITGPEAYLLSGESFSISELKNMEKAFGQEGLGSYEIVGGRVRIPHGQRNDYMAALAKHDALPEDFGDILSRALDNGSSFMPPSEREARLRIAKQQELSRFISSMRGIEKGAVMYDVDTKPGLGKEKVVTAIVTVKPAGTQPLEARVTESIRLMVAKGMAGLDPKDVVVGDLNSNIATLGSSENFGSPHNDPYFQLSWAYEQRIKENLLKALGRIPGLTVATWVELDPEHRHREERVNVDGKPVVLQQSESSVTETVEPTPPAGPPGYQSQGNTPRRLTSVAAMSSRQEREETESTQQSVVNRQFTESEKTGLIPERVKVAVTVPTSYFESVWHARNDKPGEEPKDPEPAELEPIRTQITAKIKETVAAVIPKPADVDDPTELVKVAEFQDLPLPPIPEPGIRENAVAWLGEYWTTLGILGLAFFSLIMLRSMVRAAPGGEAKGGPSVGSPSEGGGKEDESSEQFPPRKLKRFGASGASLKDELSELVGEDPESAANILRNWIGNVT